MRNTRLAHAVIAAAQSGGDVEDVVEALFTGRFCEGVGTTDPGAILALLRVHGPAPDPEALVHAARARALDARVDADLQIGAEVDVHAVSVFIANGTRGVVGAQPPEASRQLVLGEFGAR